MAYLNDGWLTNNKDELKKLVEPIIVGQSLSKIVFHLTRSEKSTKILGMFYNKKAKIATAYCLVSLKLK